MIEEVLQMSSYFGLAITLFAFQGAMFINKKFKISLLSPILVASIIIIGILLVLDISYETYEKGAQLITKFLTPATVCYAVPLYRQVEVLKKNFAAILISVMCGCVSALSSIFLFSKLFQFDKELFVSLLPKSITTAIGMSLSEEMGGIVAITVAAIVITGIFGSAAAIFLCRVFKITNPVAKGLGIGTASHAVGTAKAIEIGDVEGAMSGLAIVIAGLTTVILVPIAANFF